MMPIPLARIEKPVHMTPYHTVPIAGNDKFLVSSVSRDLLGMLLAP